MKVIALLKETFREFTKDKCPRLAAALAYYSLFSLAPLLIIAISVAGMVFGQQAARGEVVATIGGVMGKTAATGIQDMIQNSSKGHTGAIATVIGIVTLLFGAAGVFGQLQDALNTIWDAPEKKGTGVLGMIKDRFLSFAMVLGVGFLLLTSLVLSAGLSAVGKYLSNSLPGGEFVWQILNFLIAFGVITVLFALIFKFLPDRKIEWREVWLGAAVTSFLFSLGKIGIGIWLGRSSIATTYGAAASLALILVWLYYSGIILFLGAEFTEVHARRVVRKEEEGVEEKKTGFVSDAHVPRPAVVYVKSRAGKGSGLLMPVATGAGGILVGLLAGILSIFAAAFLGVRRLIRW